MSSSEECYPSKWRCRSRRKLPLVLRGEASLMRWPSHHSPEVHGLSVCLRRKVTVQGQCGLSSEQGDKISRGRSRDIEVLMRDLDYSRCVYLRVRPSTPVHRALWFSPVTHHSFVTVSRTTDIERLPFLGNNRL